MAMEVHETNAGVLTLLHSRNVARQGVQILWDVGESSRLLGYSGYYLGARHHSHRRYASRALSRRPPCGNAYFQLGFDILGYALSSHPQCEEVWV